MELLRYRVSRLRPRPRGFTLAELLVAMGVLATVIAIGTPVYAGMRRNVELQNTVSEALVRLRTAHERSVIAQGGMGHGVSFTADQYTTFAEDYSQTQDIYLQGGIEVLSGDVDVVFERLTGTTTPQDITIGYPSGDTQTIHISALGIITLN